MLCMYRLRGVGSGESVYSLDIGKSMGVYTD